MASGDGCPYGFSITTAHVQAFAQIYNEGLLDYDKVRPGLPPSFAPLLAHPRHLFHTLFNPSTRS